MRVSHGQIAIAVEPPSRNGPNVARVEPQRYMRKPVNKPRRRPRASNFLVRHVSRSLHAVARTERHDIIVIRHVTVFFFLLLLFKQ